MKTVIITGASGQLGGVVTKKFLEANYKVIATVRTAAAKKEFPADKNLFVVIVDLADEASVIAFVDDVIKEHQQVDALLMLAGGFAIGNIHNTDASAIRKQIALNFETAFHIARPVFRHMLTNEYGRLVFIGSRPALEAAAGQQVMAYALSKSLLFTFAELLNAEGKTKNVTATILAPSIIDTAANRKDMPQADFSKWVSAESIADILEFIVSGKGDPLRETMLKVYGEA